MTVYNTRCGTLINLDNVEKVTNYAIENGYELTLHFVSGKHNSIIFKDEESCKREYRNILLIMSKED